MMKPRAGEAVDFRQHCWVNNRSSCNRVRCSQIRLSEEPEPLFSCYAPVLPRCSLNAPLCSLRAPSLRPFAPSMLPLKQPCSLSRPRIAIPSPKFGVYIIYIYIFFGSVRLPFSKTCSRTSAPTTVLPCPFKQIQRHNQPTLLRTLTSLCSPLNPHPPRALVSGRRPFASSRPRLHLGFPWIPTPPTSLPLAVSVLQQYLEDRTFRLPLKFSNLHMDTILATVLGCVFQRCRGLFCQAL